MKTFYLLLALLLCTTPLHAEKVPVLTELEMLQDKLWYLQRDVGENKAALAEQQKQLKGLAAGVGKDSKLLKERLAALDQAAATRQEWDTRLAALAKTSSEQQERLKQLESSLVKLGEALSALTDEVKQQEGTTADQATKLGSLAKSVDALRGELAAQQTGAGQNLGDLRAQLEETRAQLLETRTRIDALEGNVGGQIKQLGYWGAGAALVLCILLTFVIALRKDNRNRRY